ncbi:hypothetical protein [Chitinophaga sancti]|uniref:hypothetical protein n=1 Tax=Chitinophaga sancti TaxID=1004 RepID=UPI003F78C78C
MLLPASLKEEAFIRLSKIAGCTILMPGRERVLKKESRISACTVLLSMHFKKKSTGCLILLKEKTLRLLSGFTGCTVLVPDSFKETAAPKEAAILPINIIPAAATKAGTLNPLPIPTREPAIIPLSTRTVRYPRFLHRYKTTIHAIN